MLCIGENLLVQCCVLTLHIWKEIMFCNYIKLLCLLKILLKRCQSYKASRIWREDEDSF